MNEIQKPQNRTKIRQLLGKEYFIAKRKLEWMVSKEKWAKKNDSIQLNHLVFEHRSMILRPLKDIEMILQENKRTNLKLAIKPLDKILIKPNETFSIWKNVGRPTRKKGYLEGLVLSQGSIQAGVGGGLCQLGNLLFWIFAHSPLTITERYRHSFDVFPDVNRKVPFGAGATLSYNYIDLQAKNLTQNTFQINLYMDNEYLYGELYSEMPVQSKFVIEERDHIMKQQLWGGYSRHNRIIQIEEKSDGELVEKELVVNHAIMMYNPYLGSNSSTEKSD